MDSLLLWWISVMLVAIVAASPRRSTHPSVYDPHNKYYSINNENHYNNSSTEDDADNYTSHEEEEAVTEQAYSSGFPFSKFFFGSSSHDDPKGKDTLGVQGEGSSSEDSSAGSSRHTSSDDESTDTHGGQGEGSFSEDNIFTDTLGVQGEGSFSLDKEPTDTLDVHGEGIFSEDNISTDTLGVHDEGSLSEDNIFTDTLGVQAEGSFSLDKEPTDTLDVHGEGIFSEDNISTDTLGVHGEGSFSEDNEPIDTFGVHGEGSLSADSDAESNRYTESTPESTIYETSSTEHSVYDSSTTEINTTEINSDTTLVTEMPTQSGECLVHYSSDDEVQWSTPNFGRASYPDNAHCSLVLSSNEPGWASIDFGTQGYDIRGGDYIDFKQPIRMAKLGIRWDGYASSNYLVRTELPTFNFEAEFTSDDSNAGSGFNVTITKKTTDCHLIVNQDGYDTNGTLESPTEANFGNHVHTKRACEWWIMAPQGKRIELNFFGMRITSSTDNDYDTNGVIVIDRAGDKYYPVSTSVDLVGTGFPDPVVSDGNRLNVLFYSGTPTDYFQAGWNVI